MPGYIAVTKTYRRRTPVTYVSLTRNGRRALDDYTAALQDLLAVVGRADSQSGLTGGQPGLTDGRAGHLEEESLS